jgi:hypothetical protein
MNVVTVYLHKQTQTICAPGPVIAVDEAIPEPSDQQISELHDKVLAMVQLLYQENRPAWEKNELVVH